MIEVSQGGHDNSLIQPTFVTDSQWKSFSLKENSHHWLLHEGNRLQLIVINYVEHGENTLFYCIFRGVLYISGGPQLQGGHSIEFKPNYTNGNSSRKLYLTQKFKQGE